MKTCKIVFPRVLQVEEKPDNISSPTQAKVKIVTSLLSPVEYSAYNGREGLKYPLVPGRFASGIVVETGEGCISVEKGTRVYLNAITAQEQDDDDEEDEIISIAGVNSDGFLRDFVVAEEDMLSPLPPAVNDAESVFVEPVALCEAVTDKLKADKGKHIAVIGADALGILLCQLLIYHRAVPILIDTDTEKLKLANKAGIYYTLEANESLLENISQLTGGRMAYGGVFITESKLSPELVFSATRKNGSVVLAGFTTTEHKITMEKAFNKNLCVYSVNNGHSYTSTAINLLVNKAVNVASLNAPTLLKENLEQTLEQGAKLLEEGKNPSITILNMM